ncbi:unnamed protein product [Cyclocybe aegerita]|uniref:Large ribosomal subunit protein mL59 domain-containing protein n=1 Tax=Cyclocybe aegerita TaxID=1973307 RepID=A0A8S0W278_CYCAE|nr:unnamed protein product [Cyclocybe aegerita]
MAPLARNAAVQVVKNFRMRELEGLMTHLRVFGPLPEVSDPTASAAAAKIGKPVINLPNPFIPRKNPKTNKWREPKYSLRRQADLVKKAHELGRLDVIPPGPKKNAFELRMKRVQESLPANLPFNVEKPEPYRIPKTWKERNLDWKIKEKKIHIGMFEDDPCYFEEELERYLPQFKLDEVAEANKDNLQETPEEAEARKGRLDNKELLDLEIDSAIGDAEVCREELAKLVAEKEAYMKEQAALTPWDTPVAWAGEVKDKKTPGSELGTRLYAGKKRMFKGHLWERELAHRRRRHSILMRDMEARVERYKTYYKKRKPNPLKPSRYSKPPKLPF